MNIHLYVQSGHSFGLEKVRKIAVIAKRLAQYDPLLCTADYRAATFAKDQLEVKKAGGVDLLTNMPNIMEKGDILIYDSNETTQTMLQHMKQYCTLLFNVGDDISSIVVDEIYKNSDKNTHTIEKLFYYGDDDYQDLLLQKIFEENKKFNIDLLMGHYMFFGNEEKLASYFSAIYDEEEYNETILDAKFVLTGSEHTALEVLANGAYPIIFTREDKEYRDLETLKGAGIPIIKNYDSMEDLVNQFNHIIETYPNLQRDIFTKFEEDIKKVLESISKYDQIIKLTRNEPLYI
jgi:hypothetical protein